MSLTNTGRRLFLKRVAAGGLLIAIPGAAKEFAAATGKFSSTELRGWIRIGSDGIVTFLSNTSELGQGTGTALAQIIANELDLDWNTVRIEMAPIEARYFNPGWDEYATFGSGGVANQFAPLRKAGAQAREMLVSAAARQWGVSPDECDTKAGVMWHQPSGRSSQYAQLVQLTADQPVPENPRLKPREHWSHIGKSLARLDLPAKVDGGAIYGIDVRVPDMLLATIMQCPQFGGRVRSLDARPALAKPGVLHVMDLGDAVAVVADSFWRARQGLDALQPQWDLSQASTHSTPQYMGMLHEAVRQDGALYVPSSSSSEQVLDAYDKAMRSSVDMLDQDFSVPFLGHATMEPMNATAHVTAHSAELWLPTQSQSATQAAVAKALGMPASAVTVHTTLAGGGFGRREELDFALQAAQISKRCGAAVKLIWSREEDTRHDYYRPAAVVRLRAGVDQHGMPVALRIDSACESLYEYTHLGEFRADAKPVDTSAVGKLPNYYQITAIQMRVTSVDAGVPVGFWRSVASSQNVFAYESLIDMLAHRAGRDPYAYRHALLPVGREQAVLDKVADMAHWQKALPQGHGRGIALCRANGSSIATVVELSVNAEAGVKLHKICTVIDCGVAVNPQNIRAQIEGGVIFALSAAFYGEITIQDGAVLQSNFHDYRLVNLADIPVIEVAIVEGADTPTGVGEEAVGPLAPALTNALFAATGQRITSLPLSRAGFNLLAARTPV
ncbi:molybdopterin cofactor-binding domain-containing protein [Undibacterium sp. TS12]|uniref:xanthine dehydrogenase family protein molybdopterin-binding subunit n=1 Tax=Undibacterium sp. TS12 TaxID=2908202 RepID=UPI001F4CB874|nr:molybdopterin cofactor-binding domain-containing protein [Undibacterium sp. TS12]MCH8620479.1 molybdopterin-dependent oxidoreductase [Undibacterium sp. TS12]